MHTLFISDLHLSEQRPQVTQAFFDFLQNQAPSAEAVYLLGDLFEFWIGDDAAPLLGAEPVLANMKQLAEKVPCYFIAGNRDFLVGEQFSQQTGFTILQDESVIDLYGTPTLILHGDSLCTDDEPHQLFRQTIVTNQEWRKGFLALNIPERIEQARMARMESNEHKSSISMEIMDVAEAAVLAAFEKHQVAQMIHGHTHRQAEHHYELSHGTGTRHVLGDWLNTNSIMKVDADSIRISNQAI